MHRNKTGKLEHETVTAAGTRYKHVTQGTAKDAKFVQWKENYETETGQLWSRFELEGYCIL